MVMADHAPEVNRQKVLRDALLLACKDHNADECIRAAASMIASLLIRFTKDRTAALQALDQLFQEIRAHVEELTHPPGATKQ
jgi:hypothetical protein